MATKKRTIQAFQIDIKHISYIGIGRRSVEIDLLAQYDNEQVKKIDSIYLNVGDSLHIGGKRGDILPIKEQAWYKNIIKYFKLDW